MATATAALASAYTPPFATTMPQVPGGTSTSLSFAREGTLSYGGASSSGGATATTSASIVDATGGVDADSLLQYFTIPYLDAHSLSPPSWRYAYILWLVIGGLLVIWSIVYRFSSGSGGLAASFRKWSIRRLVIGGRRKDGRRKRMWASPTTAQLLAIASLVVLCFALAFVGPDYINPTTCTFGGDCGYQYAFGTGPPKTTYRAMRRSSSPLPKSDPAPPTPAHVVSISIPLDRRGVNNPNGWAPFNDPLLSAPNHDASNWWSASDRLGLVAFAMFPLAVTLAVKQWPFNIWASPFLISYHFDKTAILHRWCGRVIWLFSTAHTAWWARELAVDRDPFGRPAFIPVLHYWRFVAGLIAYGLLCIIVVFSFNPIRTRYYEVFYVSHVGLVVLFLVACIIHGHALMWWAIAALSWWGAERMTRLAMFAYVNGFGSSTSNKSSNRDARQSFTMLGVEKVERYSTDAAQRQPGYPPTRYDSPDSPASPVSAKRQSYYAFGPGQDTEYLEHHHYPRPHLGSPSPTPSSSSVFKVPASSPPTSPSIPRLLSSYDFSTSTTRPKTTGTVTGWALAQLLPGRTVRITLRTPRPVRWSPGQHLYLTIPAVKLFQAHPYTILSVDERAPGVVPIGEASMLTWRGSEVVLLIRAQKGFSKALWEYVAEARKAKEVAGAPSSELVKGVSVRALVSWPLGSAGRVSWENYESLLVICGGTGITFGVAVLEYVCRRMARQNSLKVGGRVDAKFKTTRVRFVWIAREHSHLAWVAPTLRRCLDMSNASQLQIDLFVSRSESKARPKSTSQPYSSSSADLAPPVRPFARPGGLASRNNIDSDLSDSDSEFPPRPSYSDVGISDDFIDSVTDLVLFDGEEDIATPELSSKILKEGKLRRARSRRSQGFVPSPKTRTTYPPPRSTRSPQSSGDFDGDSERGIGVSKDGRPQFAEADYHLPSRASTSPYPDYADTGSFAELGGSRGDERSDAYSVGGGSVLRLMESTNRRERIGVEDEAGMDLSQEDWEDLDVVAELARPGHPKLDKVLDDEMARSDGKTMVACCGPTELNTVMRQLVSSRIDVAKAFRGDPTGEVTIVVEDFSF